MRYLLGLSLLFLIGMAPAYARTSLYGRITSDLRQLDGAVETFSLEHKRLPSEMEGLDAVKEWVRGNTVPLDPWGNPYIYRKPGYYRTNTYEVYSMGADGISNTGGGDPDDINPGDGEKRYAKYYHNRLERRRYWKVQILNWTCLALFCLLVGIWVPVFRSTAQKPH